MLLHLLMLLGFQLAGELIVMSLSLLFPGPLLGMLLLLGWLTVRGGPTEQLATTSTTLVNHLGLFFIPAGTAIMTFGTLMYVEGTAIAVALIVSTAFALLVSGKLAEWLVRAARGSEQQS